MLLATTLVALVPALSAWWLRNQGVLPSALECLLFCVVLSICLSVAGAAYWKRRRNSADIMFSELLVWGWLRRLWRERQLRNVPALVESTVDGHYSDQLTVDRRRRMLARLASAIEARDPYIDGHSRRVARHSEMIAEKLRLPADQVARIRTAGALHDVGKLSTPSDVLGKPGRLTEQEFEVVKRHAREGALMVTCLEDPELTEMVRCHHERLDGSGYPDGLEADEIPLGARIVAVADVFDAITAPRPYRPAAPHQRAFAVLSSEEGTRLDAEVVEAFVRCYSGRRTVALWAVLSAFTASALAHTRGLLARRRLSLRDLLNTATAMAATAAAAVAAPLSPQAARLRPSARPDVVAASSYVPPPARAHAHARPRHHARHGKAASRAARVHQAPAPPASPSPTPVVRTPSPHSARHTAPAPRHRSPAPTPPRTKKPPPRRTTPSPPPPTTTTTTATPPPTTLEPTSKQQCMRGGYVQFHFPNQGQCIDWVVHHAG